MLTEIQTHVKWSYIGYNCPKVYGLYLWGMLVATGDEQTVKSLVSELERTDS